MTELTMFDVICAGYKQCPAQVEAELRKQGEIHLDAADSFEKVGNPVSAKHARQMADDCMICANATRLPFNRKRLLATLADRSSVSCIVISFTAACKALGIPRATMMLISKKTGV